MKTSSLLGWVASAGLLALALGAPAPSQAQILVNNSPPDHATAYFSDTQKPQWIASPFTLASTATVGGFNFWGVFTAGGPTSSFVLNFFTNAAGQPGALLGTTSATATGTATGATVGGNLPEYLFHLDVAPLALGAGNYFVSVFDTSSGSTFAWETSSQSGTVLISIASATGPWSSGPGATAFQITGPSAVPDGGGNSALLLGLGLAGLLLAQCALSGRRVTVA